jgi:hypothetical protein
MGRIPIRALQEPTAQAVHRRRMHAEQALRDLRMTSRQRSLRQREQDLRYLPLAIARGLVSKHRAALQLDAVARPKIPNICCGECFSGLITSA